MTVTELPRPRARRLADRDAGSITLELAVLAPALLLLLGLLILAGRVGVARSAVDHSASVAARDASMARTADGARIAANEAVVRELGAQDIDCATASVEVDTAGFAAPLGEPAVVEVTVTCAVNLADLAIPGLPGERVITSSFVSPLDAHRARP